MTFTQLQAEVRARLDEATANFYSDQDVKDALNEAYQEMADESEWYERNATIALTANAVYYDLSSASILTDEFLSLRWCYNTQTTRWLEPSSVYDLDRQYRAWENTTGAPDYFFMRGLWNVGLYPKPAATSGTVRLYYSAVPAALSAGGDTPSFHQEFHLGLVEYALYDLYGQDAETKEALRHWQQYRGYADGLRAWVQGRISRPRLESMKG